MTSSNTRTQRFVAVFLVTLALFVSATCSHQQANSADPTPVLSAPPSTTFPLPPITSGGASTELGWTMADGKRVKLSDHRGKVLVLDLYATWCEPCRQSIPHLIELQRRHEPNGLQVIGLNVGGPDDRVKVAGFAEEFHISYPLGFPDQPLVDLLLSDDSSIPQTFIFNREGKLLQRFIGYDDSLPGRLEQLILAELKSESK